MGVSDKISKIARFRPVTPDMAPAAELTAIGTQSLHATPAGSGRRQAGTPPASLYPIWFMVLAAVCFPIIQMSWTNDVRIVAWPLEVSGFPAFRDFSNLWSGGVAALGGQFERLFVKALHTQELQRLLGVGNPHLVWSYPPTALLPLVPFGLFPYAVAVVLWCALGVGVFLAAVGLRRDDPLAFPLVGAIALSPGVFLCFTYGQTALVTSGILAFGILWASKRPLLAGALLALLVAKPQIAVVVPVVLLALSAWRAFFATAGFGLLYLLATLVAFGLEPWRLFMDITLPQQLGYLDAASFDAVMLMAPYFLVRSFGADPSTAYIVQGVLTLALMGWLYLVLRKETDDNVRFVMVACAVLIASPYLQTYELPLLVLAVARVVAAPLSTKALGAMWTGVLMFAVTVAPFLTLAVLGKNGINFTCVIPFALLVALGARSLLAGRSVGSAEVVGAHLANGPHKI